MTKPTLSKSGAIKFRNDTLPKEHASAEVKAKLAKQMTKKELSDRGNDPTAPKAPLKSV